jgi:hypothetical protein
MIEASKFSIGATLTRRYPQGVSSADSARPGVV